MLIPGESLSTASLVTAKSNHLLLAASQIHTTLIWVLGEGVEKTGLFLNDDNAGLAFRAAGNHHWAGAEIGPVQVRVDPGSASAGEHGPEWRLRAATGSLMVQASIKTRGFKIIEWLPIADITTLENHCVYFDRWAIGLLGPTRDDWLELVRFEDGNLSSEILRDGEPGFGYAETQIGSPMRSPRSCI